MLTAANAPVSLGLCGWWGCGQRWRQRKRGWEDFPLLLSASEHPLGAVLPSYVSTVQGLGLAPLTPSYGPSPASQVGAFSAPMPAIWELIINARAESSSFLLAVVFRISFFLLLLICIFIFVFLCLPAHGFLRVFKEIIPSFRTKNLFPNPVELASLQPLSPSPKAAFSVCTCAPSIPQP